MYLVFTMNFRSFLYLTVCRIKRVWRQRVRAALLTLEDQVLRLSEHSESLLQSAAASVPQPGELPWQRRQQHISGSVDSSDTHPLVLLLLLRTCQRAAGAATRSSRPASLSSRPTRTSSRSPRATSSAWAGRRRGAGGRARSTAAPGGSPATMCGSWKEAVGDALAAFPAL